MIDPPTRLIAGFFEDRLENVEHASDGLIVSRVDANRPLMAREDADDRGELWFHALAQLRPRGHEVLEAPRRPGEVLAGAFDEISVEARRRQIDLQLLLGRPPAVVVQLAARLLSKQIV